MRIISMLFGSEIDDIHKIVDNAARQGRDLTPAERKRVDELQAIYDKDADEAPKRKRQGWF